MNQQQQQPAARVLSSPSGGAAEDNVEKCSGTIFVMKFSSWDGTGRDDDRRRQTDDDGRTDVKVEIFM